jgi:hypothetical protein
MRFLAFLTAFALSGIALAEEPGLVKVYCFSADLEAGFKDKSASWFCEILQERGKKKKSLAFAEKLDAAMLIEYVGLEKKKVKDGTTLYSGGIAVNPERVRTLAEVQIIIGEFSKTFSGESTPSTADTVESWIRENREVILQKAREK